MALVPGAKKVALINNEGIVENIIVVRNDADLNEWVRGTIVKVHDITDKQCGKGCYYSSTKDEFYHPESRIILGDITDNDNGFITFSSLIDILDELGSYTVELNGQQLDGQPTKIAKTTLQLGLNQIVVNTEKGIKFYIDVVKVLTVTDERKQQVVNDLKVIVPVLGGLDKAKQAYLQSHGIQYKAILSSITEQDLEE